MEDLPGSPDQHHETMYVSLDQAVAINSREQKILRYVCENDEVSVTDVSSGLDMPKGDVSQITKELADLGLIVREKGTDSKYSETSLSVRSQA